MKRMLIAIGLLLGAAGSTGCGGCDYVLTFELHATVLDATTGQPIPAPSFVDGATGQPLSSGDGAVSCDGDAGPCMTWRVIVFEHESASTLVIGATGYVSQMQTVPMSGPSGRCANAGDTATMTFRLTPAP